MKSVDGKEDSFSNEVEIAKITKGITWINIWKKGILKKDLLNLI